MLEIEDVSRRFGRGARTIEALRNVTLSVATGETCAIVGPNGAGKTTLFGLALGFLRPDAGAIRIEGRDPRDWVRRHGAGWLPERFTPPPDWRVGEMLTALARLDGGGRAAARWAGEAMDRLGLGPHARRRVVTLSRGMLQRLGLAQALCARHRLIVLDEPTDGLDLEGRSALRAVLTELHAAGSTVLLASHDLAEVERMADRAVLLADGAIRDSAPTGPAGSRCVLHLDAPEALVRAVFPDAERDDAATEAAPHTGLRFLVRVENAAVLNAGLARLIEGGGQVLAVVPERIGLEARVSRALRQEHVAGTPRAEGNAAGQEGAPPGGPVDGDRADDTQHRGGGAA